MAWSPEKLQVEKIVRPRLRAWWPSGGRGVAESFFRSYVRGVLQSMPAWDVRIVSADSEAQVESLSLERLRAQWMEAGPRGAAADRHWASKHAIVLDFYL